ncbi:MAG: CpsD/CapB family tyrosine-protein kinase [Rubrobacteraceae bacterium]|nr:CpsD/CapB family tyrosine-protein kinase [Rubrobacteraceae bacterium]
MMFERDKIPSQPEETPAEEPLKLVSIEDPMGPAAEAYRTLRTNLFYAFVDDPPRVIVITSPGPKEGKSLTCANLGVVLAQAGRRTLIVDCDLRLPSMHHLFGLRNFQGVVDLLAGGYEMRELWHEPVPGLRVLTSGPLPPNPAETLGSRRFAELLAKAREEFDYVLLDAPPVGAVSDPVILATQGDGVLIVLDAQGTRKGSLRQSLRSLEAVRANVLGTVVNNVDASKKNYATYQLYTAG